jgi:hypothetical protein
MKTKGKLSSSGASGKEIKSEVVPSRFSRTTVTGPNDMARAMNNYSKIQKPEPKDSFGSFGAIFGG